MRNRESSWMKQKPWSAGHLKSAPKSGAYLDSLGLIYFKQGKLDAAIENLEQATRYLPDTPEILLHLVDAYLEKGLKQKAVADFGASHPT